VFPEADSMNSITSRTKVELANPYSMIL